MLRFATLFFIGLLAARPTQAQFVSQPTQALAARDSLFARADTVRQQIMRITSSLKSRTPQQATWRVVVRGYYTDSYYTASQDRNEGGQAKRRLAWQHTTLFLPAGNTRELFTAYFPGASSRRIMLQERRHNGKLTWLKVQNYDKSADKSTPRLSGSYTVGRYVRWSGKTYVLPAQPYRI